MLVNSFLVLRCATYMFDVQHSMLRRKAGGMFDGAVDYVDCVSRKGHHVGKGIVGFTRKYSENFDFVATNPLGF